VDMSDDGQARAGTARSLAACNTSA